MKRVAILGSTGSIGTQTLQVIASHPDSLSVCCLACRRNTQLLLGQAAQFGVNTLVCETPIRADGYTVYSGQDAMVRYAAEGEYDVLVVAVVGIAGLAPTLAALERGKTVCLANKETLVCGGSLVRRALSRGGTLLPIDSEHCALHQCLGGATQGIKRLILTASGGALRDHPIDSLPLVTRADVLAHPNWDMGDKITVDCATMVNKGFEVVEAKYLYDVDYSQIEVLVHRQSIVHSMVQWQDNFYLAQLAVPDMRLPIQYALLYPLRVPSLCAELDLTQSALTFDRVDALRYPAFGAVLEAAARGSASLVALNAADEVAVDAFLGGHIAYTDIHTILCRVSASFAGDTRDLADVLRIDRLARQMAKEGVF